MTRRLVAATAAPAAALAALAALALRRHVDLVAVGGRSMAPALLPGDLLVIERISYTRRPPRRGEVVVAPDPRMPARELVKRVSALDDGTVELRGDNVAASTDARTFGRVPMREIRWRAAFRYWPPRRIGPVARSLLAVEGDRHRQ